MIVIVDSDGLIGLLDKDDAHCLPAQAILLKLTKKDSKFIYPATVITESVTVLKLRLKKPELADRIVKLLLGGQLIIESVDESLLKVAVKLLEGKGGHDTLFDGVVAAVAKKYQADAIFSFDQFYKSEGFKLASELT